MPAKRTDPAELRAAAEAQLERLRGPQWSSHFEEDDAADWLPSSDEPLQDTPCAAVAEPAFRMTSPAATRAKPAAVRRQTTTPRAQRKPGRPAFETPRLPSREVRIPVVVDERAREVSAWGGIEPTEALWLLVALGWEVWASTRGRKVAMPFSGEATR